MDEISAETRPLSVSSASLSQWIVAGVLRLDAHRCCDAGCRCHRHRPVAVMRWWLLMLVSRGRRVLFVGERVPSHDVRALVDVFHDAVHQRRRQTVSSARQPVTVRLPGTDQVLQSHTRVLVADTCRVGNDRSSTATDSIRDVVCGLIHSTTSVDGWWVILIQLRMMQSTSCCIGFYLPAYQFTTNALSFISLLLAFSDVAKKTEADVTAKSKQSLYVAVTETIWRF